ncbi:MAG: hypothetical protein RLQ73_25230 [Hoeflea sp. D1-CHI-28]
MSRSHHHTHQGHGHSHVHGPDHAHHHGHEHSHHDHHDHAHGPGHNHGHDHMHSHVHANPDKERLHRLQALAAAFIEGFRKAEDKPAFIELSQVATRREGSDGLTMHLVDAAVETKWQLGTASPAFGSRELVHLPYPAAMVRERETMTFTYVSLTEREDVDIITLLNEAQPKREKKGKSDD